jgi:nicotinate-nucleotide adenylyltransferase
MTSSLYGIFGGTFDPVHNGHLNTVTAVQKSCNLEHVHFIPAGIPPHRKKPVAASNHRARMVALAVANHSGFDMDDRELKRNSPSYTYDTVESLQSENQSRKYCLILGIDALAALESWYRWRELLGAIHFIVMGRPGWKAPRPLPDWWQEALAVSVDELKLYRSGKIYAVAVPPSPVSSTEIRYGISRGVDVSSMIPAPVWEYICTHNLYGA